MTAAEKRAKFVSNLRSLLALASGGRQSFDDLCQPTADLLTFTDDEPATPAQKPDWRDEAVKTGWEKTGLESVERKTPTVAFQVMAAGEVYAGFTPLVGPNNDPLSRCRAIDQFIAGLEGKA